MNYDIKKFLLLFISCLKEISWTTTLVNVSYDLELWAT